MSLRIIVAGSRSFCDYEKAKAFMDDCLKNEKDLIVLSGCCRGADALGERYARENGFPIERHPADWKRFGKAAGPPKTAGFWGGVRREKA